MEAWTPEGNLLVSSPGGGIVYELRPSAAGTATVTTLLSHLTFPQGLAFARLDGSWVLYVAESDQIDRYPWGSGGISGPRTVIAGGLPDLDSDGDDVHRAKDVTVAGNGTVYFNVGSSSNANPDDRTMLPQRAVIMSVQPDGSDLRVEERGVRNGEGLAVAPDGSVWTAVNERDNIPYPSHSAYATYSDAFGQVIQAYVNNHPPDEVVPVTAGRDLGWPYCDPDQDDSKPAGSLADVPLVANAVTNPGGRRWTARRWRQSRSGFPRTARRWASRSSKAARFRRHGREVPLSPRTGRGTGSRRRHRRCCGWPGTLRRASWSQRLRWSAGSRTLTAASGDGPWTRCQGQTALCM